jgi:hypothetical protein
MNRLVEHISFLLFENDFIIVPGLGGFVVNKEQAYTDDAKQTLNAPYHWIGFNQALAHNDGLLLELYMKALSISSVNAEQVIKEDVMDLKKELFVSKWISLGNWGKLYLNEENIICFNNSPETHFVKPQLFGLDNLSIRSLADLRVENAKEGNSDKRLTLRKTIGFAAASAAAALLLFAISIPISEKRENNNQLAGFLPGRIISSDHEISKSTDSSKDTVSIKLPQGKNQGLAKQDGPQVGISEESKYFLIVGTFQTTAVANKELKIFQGKGFDDSGIIGSSKAKRIYVAKFGNVAQANGYLSKFVEQHPLYKDAWIYNLKKTDKLLINTSNPE